MLFLSFFYDVKNGHFCSYLNLKGDILQKWMNFLPLLDIPIWRTLYSMLKTHSYGNVRVIEEVAML